MLTPKPITRIVRRIRRPKTRKKCEDGTVGGREADVDVSNDVVGVDDVVVLLVVVVVVIIFVVAVVARVVVLVKNFLVVPTIFPTVGRFGVLLGGNTVVIVVDINLLGFLGPDVVFLKLDVACFCGLGGGIDVTIWQYGRQTQQPTVDTSGNTPVSCSAVSRAALTNTIALLHSHRESQYYGIQTVFTSSLLM